MRRLAVLATLGVLLGAPAARAGVTLPAVFGDHMVLQRGALVPVWGTAEPGRRVIVRAGGREAAGAADAGGRWRVVLDPIEPPPDGAIEMVVAAGGGEGDAGGDDAVVTIRDVLVGEVWVCAGQSNMGFSLQRATGAAEAMKAADRPGVRLFTVGRAHDAAGPRAKLTGRWEVCTPASARDFSAVAYFFGAELHETLDTPVGLIEASWGGTRAEAWMPRPAFDRLDLPYEPAWTRQWLDAGPQPGAPPGDRGRPYQAPATLYNGMVAPLAGYAIRGALWYQGETNTAHGGHYRDVLAALITGWRGAWGQGDFPFLVVQLPNFEARTRDWPTLRAAQARVARELPNVGLVVTIDVGASNDIHPPDKRPVGHRAALAAERVAYGRDVPHAGPAFKSMRVEGGQAAIEFDHAFGGLVAKGGELLGFEVAGEDGKFVPATARIDGGRVVVSAAGVAPPRAVRYAWANDPKATLSNRAGLPAGPFEAAGE